MMGGRMVTPPSRPSRLTVARELARCRYIDHPHIMPGWGCCACSTYNAVERPACKQCGHRRCLELKPDEDTGRSYADRKHNRDLPTDARVLLDVWVDPLGPN